MTAFIEPRVQQTAVAAVLSAGEKRSRALVHFIMGRAAVELREYFKQMWRQKYRREWDPTGTDKYSCPWGELSCHDLFIRVEEDNTRNEKRLILDDEKELRRLISSADPSDWDFSLVCKILLHSWDKRMRSFINHGELSEVDSGEHVSWLLGLSDEMLSCKHCRIYYKGGEWFVETLGKFLAKVKRYRGDEKLQVKFGHPMNLRNGDQITINKSYRFVCHVHHMPFQHCDPIPRILGQDGDLGEAPKKATGLTELTAGTAGLAIATRSEQHSDV